MEWLIRCNRRARPVAIYATLALGPHDLPTAVNNITPTATSAPHISNGIFERIERSENIASARVTPDPEWFMLAGRTFDLVVMTAILA